MNRKDAKTSKKQKITAKQEAFCREYVIDSNATKAAIKAGYSERTAQEQSSRLLTNENIQNYITKLKKKITAKFELKITDVLNELKDIGWKDPEQTNKMNYSDKIKALQTLLNYFTDYDAKKTDLKNQEEHFADAIKLLDGTNEVKDERK